MSTVIVSLASEEILGVMKNKTQKLGIYYTACVPVIVVSCCLFRKLFEKSRHFPHILSKIFGNI
jgi:hypothetical protein